LHQFCYLPTPTLNAMTAPPVYIRFLQWAEERADPFTFLDAELFLGVPRELVVKLVVLAVENKRVVQVDQAYCRVQTRRLSG
jgi:hypothetical protein